MRFHLYKIRIKYWELWRVWPNLSSDSQNLFWLLTRFSPWNNKYRNQCDEETHFWTTAKHLSWKKVCLDLIFMINDYWSNNDPDRHRDSIVVPTNCLLKYNKQKLCPYFRYLIIINFICIRWILKVICKLRKTILFKYREAILH